eukprot:TRINITY_DN9879_c0_g1_i1.p1 TRINITY_DN9879_c0_g1~~TRINITY_DN9879_c0_g1_i1.p1  ORF type:complete len:349 (+),score=102.42 TRINITY_DN9879_c0_g1_i1:489-1535(+)
MESVFKKYNVSKIFPEADNVWALFPDGASAALAALEITRILNIYNKSVPNEDWEIRISGVGVDEGDGIYINPREGKFYGRHVDIAFKLGEDIVEDGEVCVSEFVYQNIKDDDRFRDINFSNVEYDDEDDFNYRHLTGDVDYNCDLLDLQGIGTDTDIFLTRSYDSDYETADLLIHEKYMKNNITVMMYGCDFGHITRKYDIQKCLKMRDTIFEMFDPIWKSFGGLEIEENFYIFDDPWDAIQACLITLDSIREYNRNQSEDNQIPLKGYGIHNGTMLLVPNSDIHWGDPVNTASKLGEDLAENGNIYISEYVYSLVSTQLEQQSNLEYTKLDLSASEADLTSYSIKKL